MALQPSRRPHARLAVVANDTRVGIQPYVALALQRTGLEVRVVVLLNFAQMFAEVKVPFAPLSGSIASVLWGSTGTVERRIIASMRFVSVSCPNASACGSARPLRLARAWTSSPGGAA